MTWSSSLILIYIYLWYDYLTGTANQATFNKASANESCLWESKGGVTTRKVWDIVVVVLTAKANSLESKHPMIFFSGMKKIKMMVLVASSWFMSYLIIGWLLKIYRSIIQYFPSLAEEVSVTGLQQQLIPGMERVTWGVFLDEEPPWVPPRIITR